MRGFALQISERRLLIAIGDVIAIGASTLLSLRLWAQVGHLDFDTDFLRGQIGWFIFLAALWLILANVNEFYDLRLAAHPRATAACLARITAQLLVIYLVLFFVSARDALPRLFILYHAVISSILIAGWRLWRPYLTGWRAFRRRALIVGSGWAAETIIATLETDAPNEYNIIGLVRAYDSPESTAIGAYPVLGTGRDLPTLTRQHEISELILTGSAELPADLFEGLLACYELGVTMTPMPILYEQITGRVPIEHVGRQHWTVVLPLDTHTISNRLYLAAKRLTDIFLALIGLIGFGLLLPFLAVIIRIDSPGSLFYGQERVGRGGKLFRVIKLRTMIANAESTSGPVWAQKRDPRITRVGAVLRKTRLDEFPQLINVLRGEMSIVGPRPERAFFVDQLTDHIPFYRTRLAVKPGLTGWAQVRYRYGNTTDDALIKLQYDLYYIRHQSMALDLLIILQTFGKMLAFQGT
jgi:exopolysaccharide biosynthesis polyprenyl glycosylphosphotransferase